VFHLDFGPFSSGVEGNMRKITCLFLSIVAFSFILGGCGKVSDDYFPLETGTIWKYKLGNAGESVDMTVKVLEHVKLDEGMGTIKLWERGDSKDDSGVELFEMKKEGIFAYKRLHPLAHYRDITMTPPQLVLKVPPVQGDTWEWKGTIFGSKSTSRFTVLPREKIGIGKRRVEAVKIMEKCTSDNGATVVDSRWYAPGVGLVRRESKVTDKDGKEDVSILELVGFEEGKAR
jgi:hypothetical protein